MHVAVRTMRAKYLASIWIVTMIAVFLFFRDKAAENGEYEIAGVLYLVILSAPLGLLLLVFWAIVGPALQGPHLLTPGGLSILVFLSLVIVGYAQWFLLLPKLIAAFRRRGQH
jgi:hypothetical protein